MKFQDDISMPHTNTHTHIRTSRNQYVPHFFKVGGIITVKNLNTPKLVVVTHLIQTRWPYISTMTPKDADIMANRANQNQNSSLRAY